MLPNKEQDKYTFSWLYLDCFEDTLFEVNRRLQFWVLLLKLYMKFFYCSHKMLDFISLDICVSIMVAFLENFIKKIIPIRLDDFFGEWKK